MNVVFHQTIVGMLQKTKASPESGLSHVDLIASTEGKFGCDQTSKMGT